MRKVVAFQVVSSNLTHRDRITGVETSQGTHEEIYVLYSDGMLLKGDACAWKPVRLPTELQISKLLDGKEFASNFDREDPGL